TRRLQEAKGYLDQWVERYPDDAEGWLRRAWVLEHLFLLDAARADYEKVLALEPGRDPVRLRVAELLIQKNRGEEALPYLEALAQTRPNDPTVRLCRVRCALLLHHTEEARALLEVLVTDHPRDAQAWGERGKLALQQGDLPRAEEWLRKARALSPHD